MLPSSLGFLGGGGGVKYAGTRGGSSLNKKEDLNQGRETKPNFPAGN